ncbi:MAG TPA: hypothetical protein VMW19_18325 [Myxococcota bacterium]|nr:hypothetical protein [Myxococcota bacterium]
MARRRRAQRKGFVSRDLGFDPTRLFASAAHGALRVARVGR